MPNNKIEDSWNRRLMHEGATEHQLILIELQLSISAMCIERSHAMKNKKLSVSRILAFFI
jgi:hypothetical protein